jgi:hypothetical protein
MDRWTWCQYKSSSLTSARTRSKVNNLPFSRQYLSDDILIYKQGYILSYVKYPTYQDKPSSRTGLAGCAGVSTDVFTRRLSGSKVLTLVKSDCA